MAKRLATTTISFSELRKDFDWVMRLADAGKVIEITEKRGALAYLFKESASQKNPPDADAAEIKQFSEVYLRQNFFAVFDTLKKEKSPVQINRLGKDPVVISCALD